MEKTIFILGGVAGNRHDGFRRLTFRRAVDRRKLKGAGTIEIGLGFWLGMVLAIVSLTIIGIIIYLAARLSRRSRRDAASARRVQCGNKILVPVGGNIPAEGAVEIARILGRERGSEIILGYVVEVPWTLPLDTNLPARRATAQGELAAAEAYVTRRSALPVSSRIFPARSRAEGILRLAEIEKVGTIVLGVGAGRWPNLGPFRGAESEIIQHAPCEVLLYRRPSGV